MKFRTTVLFNENLKNDLKKASYLCNESISNIINRILEKYLEKYVEENQKGEVEH